MKANATGSKATTTKVPSAKKLAVPVMLAIPVVSAKALVAKPARRGRAKVDIDLPIAPPAPAEPIGTSKQARLIGLLNAGPGATLEQMMSLTGWQAHTVRGAISGVLRKRLGLNMVCDAAEASDARRYRIVAVGARAWRIHSPNSLRWIGLSCSSAGQRCSTTLPRVMPR